jgi:TIR domain
MTASRSIRTCFVSAPQGAPLESLRESLVAHGITLLVPQELSAGADWASEVEGALQKADLVVGILPTGEQSPWVLFELGQAWGLGKRLLVIAPPGSQVPGPLQRLLILQTDVNNRQALDFALDQLTSAPPERPAQAPPKALPLSSLGGTADDLIVRLNEVLSARDWRGFEELIAHAIRQSGTDVVVQSQSAHRDQGFDLAVWSDALDSVVGNPLLIEMKLSVRGRDVFHQLGYLLGKAQRQWGVLIYGEGPPQGHALWKECPVNLIPVSAHALLEALKARSFPDLIRSERNRRVHGVGPVGP